MPGNNPSDLAGKPPEDRRKLITVMYADMVGYSRLIGLDDAGTLQRRLVTLSRPAVTPARRVRQHRRCGPLRCPGSATGSDP